MPGTERQTVTLHLPRDACVITDDEVLSGLDVDRWRSWLPAFEAALAGMPSVEDVEVRGEG